MLVTIQMELRWQSEFLEGKKLFRKHIPLCSSPKNFEKQQILKKLFLNSRNRIKKIILYLPNVFSKTYTNAYLKIDSVCNANVTFSYFPLNTFKNRKRIKLQHKLRVICSTFTHESKDHLFKDNTFEIL